MELLIQTITHINAQNLFLPKQLKYNLFLKNAVLAETGNFFVLSQGGSVNEMCKNISASCSKVLGWCICCSITSDYRAASFLSLCHLNSS